MARSPSCLSYPDYAAQRFFPGLDGVRAVSILAVMTDHVREATLDGRFEYWAHGGLGVDMFFVLSGFLIVTLLLREQRDTGGIDLRNFYIRRALRILPIYWLMIGGLLAFYLAISPWRPNGLVFYASEAPILLAFLQDLVLWHIGVFAHTWSLAVEEQFYVLWPQVEKRASPRLLYTLLLGVFLLSQASNFGLTNGLVDAFYGEADAHRRPLFLCTFTPLVFGTLLAHLLHKPESFARAARVLGNPLLFPLSLATLIGLVSFVHDLQGLGKLTIHLAMTLMLGSLLLRPADPQARLLASRVPSAFGRVSYFVYLFHVLILYGFYGLLARFHLPIPPMAVSVMVAALGTWPFAVLSQTWIEGPMRTLRERFESTQRRAYP